MAGSPNRYPNFIQRFEPIVSGRFITHLSPEPFLRIQRRLIRRQIFQTQTPMGLKENFDCLSRVPLCTINIKPDSMLFQGAIKMFKAIQEAVPVTLGRFYQSIPAQKRRNPAENVNPRAMVAGSGDAHTFTFLCPHSAEPGMQRESRLVFKHNRLMRPKRLKFFLKQRGISSLLLNAPGYTSSRRVSGNSLTGEANTEPGEPLFSRQSVVSDGQQVWGRPTERGLFQGLMASSPNLSPISDKYPGLTAKDARFWVSPLMPLSLDCLPCASRDSSSGASNLIPRLSIPDADPPVSAIGQLSSNPSMPPGSPKYRLSDALGLHRDALKIKWDFSCIKATIIMLLCQNIYCVCISYHYELPVVSLPATALSVRQKPLEVFCLL